VSFYFYFLGYIIHKLPQSTLLLQPIYLVAIEYR
jgi:hypothetical protein